MQGQTQRTSVDLSAYPKLIMILLGFRVRRLRGVASLLGIGRGLGEIDRNRPDGLLANEQLFFGLTHIGIRQYWRDLESLEAFTRSGHHARWWREFAKGNSGAGFWHETYRMQGGIEAIYVDMPGAIGLGRFAPELAPVGPFLTARERLKSASEQAGRQAVEDELHRQRG